MCACVCALHQKELGPLICSQSEPRYPDAVLPSGGALCGAVGHPPAKISHKGPTAVCKHSAIDFMTPHPPRSRAPSHLLWVPSGIRTGSAAAGNTSEITSSSSFPTSFARSMHREGLFATWSRRCFTGCVSCSECTSRGGGVGAGGFHR